MNADSPNPTHIRPRCANLKNRSVYAILILMLLVAAYLLFVNLDIAPIPDYDAPIHGINAYEMIRNNDYLVHTARGGVDYWNLKPPLTMWSIVLFYHLFGFTIFAFRFYSPLSMLLMMVIITFWLKRRHGSASALAVMALLLATQIIYHYHFGRDGDPDSQFQLFFTIAMLCMLESPRNFRMLYGSAVCFGLAFLAKSGHALFIPVICFAFVMSCKQRKQLTIKRGLLLIGAGVFPILPWAVARFTRDGFAFFSKMITIDLVARVTSALEYSDEPFSFYFVSIVTQPIFIACALLSVLCWVLCKMNGRKLQAGTQQVVKGCILWAVIPPIVYSFAVTKHFWYVFGSWLAMVLMAAVLVGEAVRNGRPGALRACILGLTLAFCVQQTVANITYVSSLRPNNRYTMMLKENLDRDWHTGMHIYIQYNEEINKWNLSDMLVALLYGDVIPLPGGVQAFEDDEDDSLLLIGKKRIAEITRVEEYSYPLDEDYYVMLFMK